MYRIAQLIFLYPKIELWFSSVVKLVRSALIWGVGFLTNVLGTDDYQYE